MESPDNIVYIDITNEKLVEIIQNDLELNGVIDQRISILRINSIIDAGNNNDVFVLECILNKESIH